MARTSLLTTAAAGVALLLAPLAHSASVFLSPSSSTVDLAEGTISLELFADFTGVTTVGGGVDFSASGQVAIASFTPSAFFLSLASPGFPGCDITQGDFTNCGTAQADGDYEVHIGSFFGFTGLNKIGDLNLNLLGVGAGGIAIAINSIYGNFIDTGFESIDVALTGAEISVVPVPGAVWLFASGLGVLLGWRRRAARA